MGIDPQGGMTGGSEVTTPSPRPAVFLDRDGVINREIWYPRTGEWEAPLVPEDLELVPGALGAMKELEGLGYLLLLVSNQPGYPAGVCI